MRSDNLVSAWLRDSGSTCRPGSAASMASSETTATIQAGRTRGSSAGRAAATPIKPTASSSRKRHGYCNCPSSGVSGRQMNSAAVVVMNMAAIATAR